VLFSAFLYYHFYISFIEVILTIHSQVSACITFLWFSKIPVTIPSVKQTCVRYVQTWEHLSLSMLLLNPLKPNGYYMYQLL